MAHLLLAPIWAHLESRVDTGSIVREIIGQYELSVIGKEPEGVLVLSFRVQVWLKVIFDMQRSFLQSSNPSPESRSHLLHPQLLLSTLKFLVALREKICGPQTGVGGATLGFKFFLVRTLLSGLRALLLRRHTFPPIEVADMEQKVELWRSESTIDLERFIVARCAEAIFLIRTDRTTETPRSHCSLPDYAHGLYPLNSGIYSSFIWSLSQTSPDPCVTFWILFDILWAVEGAFIQYCAVVAQEDDSERNTGMEWRAKVLEEVYSPHYARPHPLGNTISALRETLMHWCSEGYDCQERAEGAIPFQTSYKQGNSGIEVDLKAFHTFLVERARELLDCEMGMRNLSNTFDNCIKTWRSDEDGLTDNELHRLHFATTYIVDCPKQHALPMSVLSGLLEAKHDTNGLEEILQGPDIIQPRVEIKCPHCPRALIKKAVNVKPLSQLSEALRQKKSEGLSGDPRHLLSLDSLGHIQIRERTPELTLSLSPRSTRATTSLDTDRYSTKSGENSASDSKSTKRTSRWKLWTANGIISKPTSLESISTPKCYAFSADGRSVVLWDVGGAEVLGFDIPPMAETQTSPPSIITQLRYPIKGVKRACRGANAVAIVSASSVKQQGNGHLSSLKLSIFYSDRESVVYERGPGLVRNMAVAQNDRVVAVSAETKLDIYHRDARTPYSVPISRSDANFESQRMNFSHDCENVIVARRQETGGTYIMIYDLSGNLIWKKEFEIPIGVSGSDRTLSSAHYVGGTGLAIVTAYDNKPYPPFHKETAKWTLGPRTFPSKLQDSAVSPSDRYAVFANAAGKLYRVDLVGSSSRADPVPICRQAIPRVSAINHTRELIALAMPEDDLVHAFWIESGKMRLATVQEDGILHTRDVQLDRNGL